MSLRRSRRGLLLENLESRQLLAAEGFHNFLAPLDVNNDQVVSPLDALSVINHVNRAVQDRIDNGLQVIDQFLDVNDDSLVTPIDALQIINNLNRGAQNVVDQVFAQLSNADGARMRAEFIRENVSDTLRERFEVRLQNGIPGREYPVLVDGAIVGTVVADPIGRGVLEIVSESLENRPVLEEIGERVRGIVRGGLVHVDGLGGVILAGEGEATEGDVSTGNSSEETVRLPDFGMLPRLQEISGPVYSTALRESDRLVGGAYFTNLDNGFSLGLVARGLEPGVTYDISVAGTTILSVTAGRYGVASLLYDSTDADAPPLLNPISEVVDGTVLAISSGSTVVSGRLDFLEVPFLDRPANRPGGGTGIIDRIERTLVAPLDGDGVDGLVTYTTRGDGYYLGIALRGADRREAYDVVIDGVTVATVRSNFLGLIVFRQVSDDAAGDGLPAVGVDSVVQLQGLASGTFITAEDGIRDVLGW